MKKNKIIISITIDEEISEIVKDNSQKSNVSISSIYEGAIIRFFGIKRTAAGKPIQTKSLKVIKTVTN